MTIETRPLSALPVGESGTITEILPSENIGRRLFDIGCIVGETVKKCGSAPFGGLDAYEICGAVIALRKKDAQNIFVAMDEEKEKKVPEKGEKDTVIALVGNPNVGKSTVFNALTGLHQHTGNWTGKTVATAVGYHKYEDRRYTLVDLPGTYSLASHSAEEEVTRDFLLSGEANAVIFVCDATALARNLALLLDILEITPNVLVCLNLMDEARRHGIIVDTEKLEALLGVPVVPTSAGKKEGIEKIFPRLSEGFSKKPIRVTYHAAIEEAISHLQNAMEAEKELAVPPRFLALRLLEGQAVFSEKYPSLMKIAAEERKKLAEKGFDEKKITEEIAARPLRVGKALAGEVITSEKRQNTHRTDKILTSRRFGIPIMLLLLALLFWLTIEGANLPSSLLSSLFTALEPHLYGFLASLGIGVPLTELLTYGLYRVVTWIVSVMLPPMAIFFPLFTILEDVGYLPRVAYNLDGLFSGCNACGKQGLCMCMGLGCNAVGVVGARIIDSKRERLLAILTAGFMPCNGRFPAMIAVATLFFVGAGGVFSSFLAAGILVLLLTVGVMATLVTSKILSKTLLKGEPSSFILELPPYRRPQIGKILLRSLLDRTLFVLGRAVAVAAPAGIIIFLLVKIHIGGLPITAHICGFLEPFGALMGLDGELLLAFLLGLPANEIVLPLAVMLYSGGGILAPLSDLSSLSALLMENGWTVSTAVCFLLFSVLHSPCTTTLLTVKKETGKWRYAALSALIPTVFGILICMAMALIFAIL